MKITLKELKTIRDPGVDMISEMWYVSSLIRHKLKNGSNKMDTSIDKDLSKNLGIKFWSTCTLIFSTTVNNIPTFSPSKCYQYFCDTVSNSHKAAVYYSIPQWIPELNKPTSVMSTYKEITQAVNKMKASSSACPLDQLSCIILKRCPILRTFLCNS